MSNEIVKFLETLAVKLGTSSEHLWDILLKQAPIYGIISLIGYIVVVLACIFWYKKTKIFRAKISEKKWEEENWIWIGIIWSLLLAGMAWIFASFPNTIYSLITPEYWALSKLLCGLR